MLQETIKMLRFLSRRKARNQQPETQSSQIKSTRIVPNKNIIQCRIILLDNTDLSVDLSVRGNNFFTIFLLWKSCFYWFAFVVFVINITINGKYVSCILNFKFYQLLEFVMHSDWFNDVSLSEILTILTGWSWNGMSSNVIWGTTCCTFEATYKKSWIPFN